MDTIFLSVNTKLSVVLIRTSCQNVLILTILRNLQPYSDIQCYLSKHTTGTMRTLKRSADAPRRIMYFISCITFQDTHHSLLFKQLKVKLFPSISGGWRYKYFVCVGC